jgi:hypothetical protein
LVRADIEPEVATAIIEAEPLALAKASASPSSGLFLWYFGAPLQEEVGHGQKDKGDQSNRDLHGADEVAVVLQMLCIVFLSCLNWCSHRDLHRLPTRHSGGKGEAMVADPLRRALISVK